MHSFNMLYNCIHVTPSYPKYSFIVLQLLNKIESMLSINYLHKNITGHFWLKSDKTITDGVHFLNNNTIILYEYL